MNNKEDYPLIFEAISPPTRTLLKQSERLFHPIIGILVTIVGSIFFILNEEYLALAIWCFFCLSALVFIYLLYLQRKKQKKINIPFLSTPHHNQILGTIIFLGSLTFLVIFSYFIEDIFIYLWPILYFPLQIFIGRYRGHPKFLLRYILLFAIIVILIISNIIFSNLFKQTEYNSNHLLIIGLWIIIFIIDASYRTIRHSLYKSRDASVRSILRKIVEHSNDEVITQKNFYKDIADRIFWLHNRHVVSIVTCTNTNITKPVFYRKDDKYAYTFNMLKLEAAVGDGVNEKIIESIQPWSARFGLTGLMVRSPKDPYLIENNTKKNADYYHPSNWPIKTKSEIVVPIRAGDFLFGMIDVQSKYSHDFSPEDADVLSAIATSLASHLQEKTIKNIYDADRRLWDDLSKSDNESKMLSIFGKYAVDITGASHVIYYPLAIGTGYPTNHPYVYGSILKSKKRKGKKVVSDIVTQLVSRGETLYYKNPQEDVLLSKLNDKDSFVRREYINSMCFIPIFMGTRKLGALFLNYRTHEDFSSLRRLSINILSQTFTHHISRIRYKDALYKRLSQPKFRLHHVLNRSGLTKDRLNIEFENIIDLSPKASKKIIDLRYKILNGYKQAYFEGSVIDIDFEESDLKSNIESFVGSVQLENNIDLPNLRILTFIDDTIEDEMADLKTILMALVTESTFNAIKHSKSDIIELIVERNLTKVIFKAINNVNTPKLPTPKKFKGSQFGIITMINELKKSIYAQSIWELDKSKRVLKLIVEIPILPPNYM